MTFQRIDIAAAEALIAQENALVVDIRDPASFSAGAIENAVHLDNTSVAAFLETADRRRPLIVCCYHGNLSQGAAEFFSGQGFTRSCSLNGGYAAWARRP